MSTESDPQTTTNDPYASMPSWLEGYYKDTTKSASENIKETEQLGDQFSSADRLIADYNGQGAVQDVNQAADKARADSQKSANSAVSGLTSAQTAMNKDLAGVEAGMAGISRDVDSLNTEFGSAFDTSKNQQQINDAAKAGTNTANSAIGAMSGAMAGIGQVGTDLGAAFDTTGAQSKIEAAAAAGQTGIADATDRMGQAADAIGAVDTDLGQAFNTTGDQSTLRGMDYDGLRGEYESEYIDAVIDPTMQRMREDAAMRAQALETSGAAIGGLTNTRMGVQQAKMAEESALAQAEAEAKMRFDAEQASQDKALQEAGLRGDMAETAAGLGLSESELAASIKERQAELGMSQQEAMAAIQAERAGLGVTGAQLGIDAAGMAAELGMSESELAASIAERQASLGITKQQAIADIAAGQGALGLETAGMNIGAANTAAGLGMSQSELNAEIARMESEMGLSKAEAMQRIQTDLAGVAGQSFDAAGVVAGAHSDAASTALAGGALGMEAGVYTGEQAELQRQIAQQKKQAPLTAQAWENEQQALASTSNPAPNSTTTTTTGGGPSMASQLIGAGTSLAGAAIAASDERVKHDIESLDGALAVIRRQRPSVYTYDDPKYDRVQTPGRRSAGLMAQDLEEIPGAVFEVGGVKHVDLYPVMATITAAVQSLDRRMNQRGL